MMFRQLVVGSPESFFCVARCILQMYKLSTVSSLESFTKLRWKNISRRAVSQYWTEKLREEAADKSSLTNCNLTEMTIGKSHQIWNNVGNNTTDVKREITKARMLTGVICCKLQNQDSTSMRWNKYAHFVGWLQRTFNICY